MKLSAASLHPSNQEWLASYRKNPHHALIVELNHEVEFNPILSIIRTLLKSTEPIHVTDSGEPLSIDNVREMHKLAVLSKSDTEPQLLVLDVRNGSSIDAQNSLLKILEEPPANTYLVLVCLNAKMLLPTIRSRCRLLIIQPLTHDQFASVLLEDNPDIGEREIASAAAATNRSFAISASHVHTSFENARKYLSETPASRALIVKSIKDRSVAIAFLVEIMQLASLTQQSLAAKNKIKNLESWVSITEEALTCISALRANGNVGLQLLSFTLRLPAVR